MNDTFNDPQEVRRILRDFPCDWCVAGGWAIDLFLNRITRLHQDIEVAIFRRDQSALQGYLASRGWSLDYIRDGQSVPWSDGECLDLPVHEIWCRRHDGLLQHMEVLLNEQEADEFVFRRDSRIRRPVHLALKQSSSGFRILAPEIVLLYKSKRPQDPKEQRDFSNAAPALETRQREWLIESLATIDPEHEWLSDLRGLQA